jgi:methyl coenzyme M reductase subunit D
MAGSCKRDSERSDFRKKSVEFMTQELLPCHYEIQCTELVKTPFILSDLKYEGKGKFITAPKRNIIKVHREAEV